MSALKILFVDRDGTLIVEPKDNPQIDRLDKLRLVDDVILSLIKLQRAGYELVMVTNQDGLGTEQFLEEDFQKVQEAMLEIFRSQGVTFREVLVCPHLPEAHCDCRKPRVGLVRAYLQNPDLDRAHSAVVGDRQSDLDLAHNMGLRGFVLGNSPEGAVDWKTVVGALTEGPRIGHCRRNTKETQIDVKVVLDEEEPSQISTGIGFFDHMLEQITRHGGFGAHIQVTGDLHVDEHHTVEDTALALGEALRLALGHKLGLERFGFLLPMDETEAKVSLDLSGRAYLVFQGDFPRASVGALPTELVPHFFRSLADALQATLHIEVRGENTHHMVEACFKGVGRALRMALRQQGTSLPSTKGVL